MARRPAPKKGGPGLEACQGCKQKDVEQGPGEGSLDPQRAERGRAIGSPIRFDLIF